MGPPRGGAPKIFLGLIALARALKSSLNKVTKTNKAKTKQIKALIAEVAELKTMKND